MFTRSLFQVALLTLLASALFVQESAAHDLPVERDLIVQLTAEQAHVLLQYRVPAGDDVARFMSRFDVDHDGRISSFEAARATPVWLPIALQGLRFELPETRSEAEEPQVKYAIDEESGALTVMAMITYRVPRLHAEARRTFRVWLEEDPHAVPTSIAFQSLAPLSLASHPDRQNTPRQRLGAGASLEATFMARTEDDPGDTSKKTKIK